MKKILLIIFLFFSLNAHSVGYGSYSCGEILAYERTNNQLQIQAIQMLIAGFVIGYNTGRPTDEPEIFPTTDADTLWYLLINECKERPGQSSYHSLSNIMFRESIRKSVE